MQKPVNQFSPDIHDQLRQSAPAEDKGAPLDGSVRAFLGSGGLDTGNVVALARTLVALAEANLPVARIVEGHINALYLLHLHAPGWVPTPAWVSGARTATTPRAWKAPRWPGRNVMPRGWGW